MTGSMMFAVWQIDGVNQTQTIGGNFDSSPYEPGNRLVFDLDVSEDSPVVRGTWITVDHITRLVIEGWQWGKILRYHPELTREDIRAAVNYAVTLRD